MVEVMLTLFFSPCVTSLMFSLSHTNEATAVGHIRVTLEGWLTSAEAKSLALHGRHCCTCRTALDNALLRLTRTGP